MEEGVGRGERIATIAAALSFPRAVSRIWGVGLVIGGDGGLGFSGSNVMTVTN
jgi:hypothetical protein